MSFGGNCSPNVKKWAPGKSWKVFTDWRERQNFLRIARQRQREEPSSALRQQVVCKVESPPWYRAEDVGQLRDAAVQTRQAHQKFGEVWTYLLDLEMDLDGVCILARLVFAEPSIAGFPTLQQIRRRMPHRKGHWAHTAL
jgi:hypothetical protein